MYEQPKVVSYDREELADLLGPVETQYCDVDVQPSTVLPGQSATLIVDFSDAPGFDGVLYEVRLDGRTVDDGLIPRAAGEEQGTSWSLSEFVPSEAGSGSYTILVRLVDGNEAGAPCSTTIEVVEAPNGNGVP